jgi:hypothetical protein
MATHRPAPVGRILLRVIGPEAAWTARVRLLDAGLLMPAAASLSLVSSIESVVSDELDPSTALDVVALIEKLSRDGELRPAMRLAQAILRPRKALDASGTGRVTVQAGIEPYWYAEALQRVVAALSGDARILGTVYAWLREEQVLSGSWVKGREWDPSVIWRPSIDDHAQNLRHHDIADSLVDSLRDLAIGQLLSGSDVARVMQTLDRDCMPIAMRIGLHALSAASEVSPEVLRAATERLLDIDLLRHPLFLREYTQLAAAVLPKLDDEKYMQWESLVTSDPPFTEEQRRRIVEHRAEDQTEDEELARYVRVRRHELLSAIGESALRGTLLAASKELKIQLGEYEHAGFRSWHSSSFGSKSPVVGSEFPAMGAAEVLETVRSWLVLEGDDGTKEGLADALRDAVAARVGEFTSLTPDFVELEPVYRSRFLDAIRDAAKSESSDINWATYLRGVSHLHRSNDERGTVDTYSARQVCSTIENAVSGSTSKIPLDLLNQAVEIVSLWLDDPDPETEGESGTDHYTRALNTTRPTAARTLIRLARASKLAHDDDFDSSSTIEAVKHALATRLAPRDKSLAFAAAMGESLGLMMWVDPGWAKSWLAAASTPGRWGDVLVTTALTTNSTSIPLLSELWPFADDILNRAAAGDAVELGWPLERPIVETIGDHLVTLALWGSPAPWPARIESFFSRVNPDSAASVLGHVGWRLMNSDDVPEEITRRAADLWDSRQAAVDQDGEDPKQLAQFHWWVHSRKFSNGWWLPRLARVVDQIDFEGRSFIAKHLEEAAYTHAGAAIEVMAKLFRAAGRSRTLSRHGLVMSAPTVIALGLRCPDSGVADSARDLMDLLGEQGVVDMDEQVSRASQELDTAR